MESDSSSVDKYGATKEQYDEDVFSFQTDQLPPIDHFSACCGYYGSWDFHYAVSFVDMFLNDALEMDYNNTILFPERGLNGQEQQVQMDVEMKPSKQNEEEFLCRKSIAKYFYMPIAVAAREMKIGLTFLKRRCRELGIKRWPYRKLISLQAIINNIKESGEEDIHEALKYLEQEKRLIEEMPDMKLEKRTKRLRQACFKANYKKRRFMGMPRLASKTNRGENLQDLCNFHDDEIRALLSDFASSSDFRDGNGSGGKGINVYMWPFDMQDY